MIVLSRWAIVRTVQLANCSRIVDWMRLSVSRSTEEVASSSTRTFDLRRMARARQINWRCPTLEAAGDKCFTTDQMTTEYYYYIVFLGNLNLRTQKYR